jgi:23S rRNA (adenine2503-C2)-methyltransferase
MSTSASEVNLLGLDRRGVEALFDSIGEARYRTAQLMKWVYHRGVRDYAGMTDLSKQLRAKLNAVSTMALPEVVTERCSVDGTRKWVLDVGNGNRVESVLIPDRGRNTLCISSQVGCMLDCSFCSTGKQGFDGNLTAAQMVGQVWLVADALRREGNERGVTNVVMMGMGEPLLNFDNAVMAASILMDDFAFGISKRRVTLSTAGVVPAIERLRGVSDVSLAVSLHAPDDALRDVLVPLNRKYPIAELLAACRRYVDHLGERRHVTIEYTLIRDVNDSREHASHLARLLRDLRCKINLIPFNPFPGTTYRTPDERTVRDFQTHLMQAGYATMLRTTRGGDIAAACGQLVGQVQDRTRRQARYLARLRDTEVV